MTFCGKSNLFGILLSCIFWLTLSAGCKSARERVLEDDLKQCREATKQQRPAESNTPAVETVSVEPKTAADDVKQEKAVVKDDPQRLLEQERQRRINAEALLRQEQEENAKQEK